MPLTMTAEREAELCTWTNEPPHYGELQDQKDKQDLFAELDAERVAHQETQAKLEAATREITVAVAVIEQDDGLVRIFRRGGNDSYTGKWEFPGGKAEPGESLPDALRRELREELAVESEIGAELDHYQYKYAKRGPISLTFFAVKLLGAPEFLEHTESAWVKPEQLADYDLMNGDMKFVATRYTLTRQLAETQAITRELLAGAIKYHDQQECAWCYDDGQCDLADTIAKAKAKGVLPAAPTPTDPSR